MLFLEYDEIYYQSNFEENIMEKYNNFDSILEKLETKSNKIKSNIEENNNVTKKDYQDLNKTQELIDKIVEFNNFKKTLEELKAMLSETPELEGEINTEIEDTKNKLIQQQVDIENFIFESVENYSDSIIMEFRPGPGGNEASLFAREMFNMYTKYAQFQKWKVDVIECSLNECNGLRFALMSIKGTDACKLLQNESGVHRVQRVPETEASGRIHTSTMAVAVLPEPEEVDLNIDEKDLRVDLFCASGAGGQHVNKTESAIRITHLPSGLVVQCQDERSQHDNRRRAMQVLRARLYELERKKLEDARSEQRKTQINTMERNEKIRTYNFHRNTVDDHRYDVISHNLESFMKGEEELNKFLNNLFEKYRESKISSDCVI